MKNFFLKRSFLKYLLAVPCIILISLFCHADSAQQKKSQKPNQKAIAVTHLSQEEFLAKTGTANSNSIVIDVRTPSEFKRGHVPSAINIPHQKILENKALLKPFLDKDMVFYCHSGVRAKKVTDFLLEKKYSNIFHLQGDYRAWQGNHQKIER